MKEVAGSGKPVLLYLLKHGIVGGSPMHVLQLVRHFSVDYDVHLCLGQSGPIADAAGRYDITIHVVPALGADVSLTSVASIRVALSKIIRQMDPDLVHVHSTFLGVVTRWVCRSLKVPCVLTVHGWNFVSGIAWRRRLAAWALEFATARLSEPLLILVSECDRQVARRSLAIPDYRMRVIHNGLPDITTHQRTPDVPVRFLMVARFVAGKDQLLLLDAMAKVEGNWRLDFVGDGETLDQVRDAARRLQHLPSGAVSFLGTRDDVPELVGRADVFVLTSRHEGLPLTIIEAMRAGLPVVASAVGGVNELVDDGVSGLLHRNGDAVSLRNALQRMIDDPILRRDFGQAGRARFLAGFTEQAMFDATNDIYRQMLNGAH